MIFSHRCIDTCKRSQQRRMASLIERRPITKQDHLVDPQCGRFPPQAMTHQRPWKSSLCWLAGRLPVASENMHCLKTLTLNVTMPDDSVGTAAAWFSRVFEIQSLHGRCLARPMSHRLATLAGRSPWISVPTDRPSTVIPRRLTKM